MRTTAALVLAGIVLTACQPEPARQAITPSTARDEDLRAHQLPGPGERVYLLNQQASEATILVRREGPLARFGHDHVIVAKPRGEVFWNPKEPINSRADLWVRVSDLEIDPSAARLAFQLDTSPDASDIEGTRRNLLEHVLEAARWPEINIRLEVAGSTSSEFQTRTMMTINGVERAFELSVPIVFDENGLSANGKFTVRQSDWDIEPFGILGGGLRVADELEVHFDIQADRSLPETNP